MNALVDVALSRIRMIVAFILLSITAGWLAYTGLPKEGSPNIDIPVLYVSVSYPGVSARDSERLLVKPLETRLRTLEGLKDISSNATEGHAGVTLEFDFGFDKDAILADVRSEVDEAKAEFPDAVNEPKIFEINTSEFPILVISLAGDAPERTLLRLAKELQDEVESVASVLEAELSGQRDELLEVIVDPLKLEAYNVTATELLRIVSANNQVVAAGAIDTGQGAFSVKLPGAIETAQDLYSIPIKTNGDRVVTLGEIAEMRRTFEDPVTIARFNGQPTIALQVKKRAGENIIETVDQVRAKVDAAVEEWPEPLKRAVTVTYSMDESREVKEMVSSLESSVITAVCLVMIVVIGALGPRSAALVGFAIPTSFLLAFALLAALGMSVNNMVMFGLILAVGMLVDGAIVVTEYADHRTQQGARPSEAYGEAARRMFWPIVSSTATTLCAFLPMLFWPGMPGQFMRYLPITLIFVLSASLLVALIFMPVTGVLLARLLRAIDAAAKGIRGGLGLAGTGLLLAASFFATLYLVQTGLGMLAVAAEGAQWPGRLIVLAGVAAGVVSMLSAIGFFGEKRKPRHDFKPRKRQRGPYGWLLWAIVKNPLMPIVILVATAGMLGLIFKTYGENNYGVEFFVDTDPQRANVYVSARGNFSIEEKDAMVRRVEERVLAVEGVRSVFAVTGSSGGGGMSEGGPADTIGSIQIELENWRNRGPGDDILEEIGARTTGMPGLRVEVSEQADGPQQGKPIQIELAAADMDRLMAATRVVRRHLETEVEGLTEVDDTLPLPGIEWELAVNRTEAGRFGADVQSVGALVQLATRGALIGTYRPDDSDDEIEIRARFPESERAIATLDSLRLRTATGLIPVSNFVERSAAPKLAEITRRDGSRVFLVRADVEPGVNANEKIAEIQEWLAAADVGPGIETAFRGDLEEQQDSQAFLMTAFAGALGLMFIILLAQFNSFYNSVLVLLAVILSVGGVLVGMMVMGQPFSIIMTGVGIVALAGIVVNNNIVLIDTYQSLEREMPRLDAIIETGRQRLRPVLLTTITTMAGLLPMMFAVSIDFGAREISVAAPTALWWTQLATAIVFGLGFATVLTLVVTPSLLALRVWYFGNLPRIGWRGLRTAVLFAVSGKANRPQYLQDRTLRRSFKRMKNRPILWTELFDTPPAQALPTPVAVPAAPPAAPPLVASREEPEAPRRLFARARAEEERQALAAQTAAMVGKGDWRHQDYSADSVDFPAPPPFVPYRDEQPLAAE